VAIKIFLVQLEIEARCL